MLCSGRSSPGNHLPATRACPAELQMSRGTVVEEYLRLTEEVLLITGGYRNTTLEDVTHES